MGHRANLILVQNKSYDLYYSHWCANTLPEDLFWGEQHAVRFIESQTKVDESGWLDDVWAEGGAVLDWDNKKMLLYGGEDLRFDIPLRHLYLKLLGKVWHGWNIHWAHEGITDLATYVEYPVEKVVTDSNHNRNAVSWAYPYVDWDTAASVRFSTEELLLFPLSGGIDAYLLEGPDLIKDINKSCGYQVLSFGDWTEDFPVGGFHIDVIQKKLEFWHACDIPNIVQRITDKWAGWDVIHHEDRFESQLASTNGLLLFQDINEAQLLEQVKALLLNEPGNPLNGIAAFIKRETAAGSQVEVNPYALHHAPQGLPIEVKKRLLQRAIDQL